MGAEYARGRVCQGPSLLGAEMSRNRFDYIHRYFFRGGEPVILPTVSRLKSSGQVNLNGKYLK